MEQRWTRSLRVSAEQHRLSGLPAKPVPMALKIARSKRDSPVLSAQTLLLRRE